MNQQEIIARTQTLLQLTRAELIGAERMLARLEEPPVVVPPPQREPPKRERRPPWNPQDVLDLREELDELPIHQGGVGPTDKIEGEAILAGFKMVLNSAFKVPTGKDGPLLTEFKKLGHTSAFWAWLALPSTQDMLFHPASSGLTFDRCELSGMDILHGGKIGQGPWDPTLIDTHWLARAYQIYKAVILNSWLHHSGGKMRDGHALYFNLNGDLVVLGCLFEELGGQALQLVNREDTFKYGVPTVENRMVLGGTVDLQNNVILNTGYSETRGSFPISIVGLGREGRQFDVRIQNLFHRCNWPAAVGGHNSRGGILIQGSGVDHYQYGEVSLAGVKSEIWNTDRQIVAINNAESVSIRESTFQVNGGSPYIDLDRRDFDGFRNVMPCKKATIENCDGNAILRSLGKVLGPVSEDMVIENGVRVS